MKIYVSAAADGWGNGTKDFPFLTISEAAKAACPGDEVIVAPGIYRECVDPAQTGEEGKRIYYRSEQKGKAVIVGSEPIKNWKLYRNTVYCCRISNSVFNDYNPYQTYIEGDWLFTEKRLHTGEVYLNGRELYEAMSLKDVIEPEENPYSWEKEWSVYRWYTQQEGDYTVIYANFHGVDPNQENVEIAVRRNCFWPSKKGIGYITVSGFVLKQAATQWAPPTAYQDGIIGPHWSKGWIIEDCEISNSKCCGISLGKYFQPGNDNKWTRKHLKDGAQTERDAVCQAYHEGWRKELVGSHIIRRCEIHHCGQAGIIGHMGGAFSLVEHNHIHHINNKQDIRGAEIAGIKLHAAIDTVIRRNHIEFCTRGIWLDWQAQGTRVTQNCLHDNMPPEGVQICPPLGLGEDLFVEVSHGPTLIDHNLMLSDCSARLSTQGFAMVHNLITGSFTYVGNGDDNGGVKYATPRYTPYHEKHTTKIAGFMTILHGDARFFNNIFVQKSIRKNIQDHIKQTKTDSINRYNMICGTFPYNEYPSEQEYFSKFGEWKMEDLDNNDKYYEHLPVRFSGNVYFNGAKSCVREEAVIDLIHEIKLGLIKKGGKIYLQTNLYSYLPENSNQMITSQILGEAFEPEQRFENPDGGDIVMNEDYFGTHRGLMPTSGPFETEKALQQPLF